MADEDAEFTTRLPSQLVKELDKLAESEKRSRNNLLEVIISNYLKKMKITKPTKEAKT